MITKFKKHWEDWGVFVLGIWLFVSPWMLRFFDGIELDTVNFLVMGGAIAVVALAALYMHAIWEEKVTMLLAFWMVISPWVLGFNNELIPTIDAIVVGVLVGIFAICGIEHDREESHHHDHIAGAH